jgi:release factor glutamine methyltransferase
MVERAIELLMARKGTQKSTDAVPSHQLHVLDLCSGCGAIGLSIGAEVRNTLITLVDSEVTPLEFARSNADALMINSRVSFIRANALETFPEAWNNLFDIIVANPPYIPVAEVDSLPIDVREGDPRMALTDGGDGLSFYRTWSKTLPALLNSDGVFLTEIGDGAANKVIQVLSCGFKITQVIKDLSGMDRAIEAIVG